MSELGTVGEKVVLLLERKAQKSLAPPLSIDSKRQPQTTIAEPDHRGVLRLPIVRASFNDAHVRKAAGQRQ